MLKGLLTMSTNELKRIVIVQKIIDKNLTQIVAAQQLGLQLLAQAAPDGYTLGCGQSGNMVIVPHTYKKVPYDIFKDFSPVALMGSNYLV